jgi:hypothetical protein
MSIEALAAHIADALDVPAFVAKKPADIVRCVVLRERPARLDHYVPVVRPLAFTLTAFDHTSAGALALARSAADKISIGAPNSTPKPSQLADFLFILPSFAPILVEVAPGLTVATFDATAKYRVPA